MTAPDSLFQLVDKFERDQSRFQQPDYNEAQLRQEFVNLFFAALGWDIGGSPVFPFPLRARYSSAARF